MTTAETTAGPGERRNAHGQPLGPPVPEWTPPPPPEPVSLAGRWVRLEPLGPQHADALHDEVARPQHDALWTYSADVRPGNAQEMADYVERRAARPGLTTMAIVPTGSGRPSGLASWLRADPANGAVEVGSILLGPSLQRTTAATEAMWLMAGHVFRLGYRRYEWKCDSLNEPSRRAAARLGFRYEGTFRQAVVYKGRSRDTAWFAMTDEDWRLLAAAYERWLDPSGFDDPRTGAGQQTSLSSLTGAVLGTS